LAQIGSGSVPSLFANFAPSEICFLVANADGSVKTYDVWTTKIIGVFSGVASNKMMPTVIQFAIRNEDEEQVEVLRPSEDGLVKCWYFYSQAALWEFEVATGGFKLRVSSNDYSPSLDKRNYCSSIML
jgi:hypothetical protein